MYDYGDETTGKSDGALSTPDLFMQEFKNRRKLNQADYDKQLDSLVSLDCIDASNIDKLNLKAWLIFRLLKRWAKKIDLNLFS